jgi:stalled ribosome alternative rescue factor ArfA
MIQIDKLMSPPLFSTCLQEKREKGKYTHNKRLSTKENKIYGNQHLFMFNVLTVQSK